MITKEQYEAAKKIVEDYERQEMLMADDEDDGDGRDWDMDYEERQEEENFEKACSCTCGAWVVGKDGRGHHVADCYCGAD